MIIQIYAFMHADEAREAALLGVDHIGFVAGRYGQVPGELSFSEAREIVASLPDGAVSTALTMSTDVDEILRMASAVKPDIVHISSDLYDVDLPAMRQLRSRLPASIRLMKAIPVGDASSVADAVRFAQASDLLLLDTKVTGFPGVGATGHTHDWNVSRQIVESVSIPVILAGGLSAENVAQAMAAAHPWGVDSNTSTNIAGDPQAKDMSRIRAFVQAVRAAEAGGAQPHA